MTNSWVVLCVLSARGHPSMYIGKVTNAVCLLGLPGFIYAWPATLGYPGEKLLTVVLWCIAYGLYGRRFPCCVCKGFLRKGFFLIV